MAEKVTKMVLKVDLQCSRCYKKVKKVLCKFPQIRDQIYDEKANTVTITVVCCSPEKIRDKICYKGGGSIKSIEIKPPPPPPKPEDSKKKDEKKDEKKVEKKDEKKDVKKDDKKDGEKDEKKDGKKDEKQVDQKNPKESEKPKDPEKSKKAEKQPPAPAPLLQMPHAAGFSCTECYHGHAGGPCYFGGPPPPSFPCYGTPVYDSWGGGGGYKYGYASCGDCLSEENPQACSIM